jgi:hypothetical protein
MNQKKIGTILLTIALIVIAVTEPYITKLLFAYSGVTFNSWPYALYRILLPIVFGIILGLTWFITYKNLKAYKKKIQAYFVLQILVNIAFCICLFIKNYSTATYSYLLVGFYTVNLIIARKA